jgi:CheY-like chemotaxis protein
LARKILLADDSVTAQNMGRKILADAGYDVVTVNNGSAALKRITEINPDLIVLDVYMPGYSGLEVCQRLKDAEETAHIPVLLTVGKLEPFKPEEARRVRADGHIVKPFEASELLTAITRLEDRMVPQQAEGGRYGKQGDDSGWKSRLGFPSKKKKEEKEEPEDFTAGGSFRDYRKGKSKTGVGEAFTVKAAPGQESGVVPDIPRDITPEELDALSAVAAKLEGQNPAAENIAPLANTTADGTKGGPVAAPAVEMSAAKPGVDVFTVEADAKKPELKTEEKTEAETPVPAVEPAAGAVEGRGEVEIPVEHVELAAEDKADDGAVVVDPAADPVAVEPHQLGTEHSVAERSEADSETQHSEFHHPESQHQEPRHSEIPAAVAVNSDLLTQEPAPVDKNDEPIFTSVASGVEQGAEEKTQAGQAEAVVMTKPDVTKPEVTKSEKITTGGTTEVGALAGAVSAANVQEMAAAEEPAPSDEELAQALRLLTPSIGHGDISTIPSHGTLVAAGQLLAEEARRDAAAGPRWVAEPVALSPEDAAISLEAEMFRAFAVRSAATPSGEIEPVRITGVSAIAAAVENRLAVVELAASAKALPEQAAEHASETRSAETPAVEASAEATAVVSSPASPVAGKNEADKIEAEKAEAEQKDSAAKVQDEAPAEEVAAATFADVVGRDMGQNMAGEGEVEATAEQNGESVRGTAGALAPAVAEGDSSSHIEGQESMGKDEKSKSGKSNWHQLRTAPPIPAASSHVVETAEPPKAMAAAAAEGSSSSATDASTIASIVDSVMADLRPKIVEEIAKKLAGK